MVEATGFEPTTFASRTRRATSCATPRFFSFLSIFVSGQTCGQATYFERFVEKYTARIVRFFKGFSDFQKSLLQDRWRCPERDALPAALRLDFFKFLDIFVSGQTCGQATYFERFVEKCTARIVSVVKGFRGSKKSAKESPCGCPERCALPAALRLEKFFRLPDKRNYYSK